jgi:PTH1 family peptidyl-tRNA hydrolase
LKGGRDNALVAETRFPGPDGDERVVLAFPITFMNESGQAVSALVRRYRIESPKQIIVIQDELDLPPGELKVKSGGGLAGHNGLRSITQHLKTQEYLRVRIGVGKPDHKDVGKGHVLSKVPKAERELLDARIADAADATELIIASGADAAMQRYNGTR